MTAMWRPNQKTVSDKGAREVVPGLEVEPGRHPGTKKLGFFAYARKLIGNFPVCWRPTEKEAWEYGAEFVRTSKRKV